MKKLLKKGFIFMVILLIFLFALFIPKLDEIYCENKYLNHTKLIQQEEKNQRIDYNLSTYDKLCILSMNNSYVLNTEIYHTSDYKQLEENTPNLLYKLTEELENFEKLSVIPKFGDEKFWKMHFKEAHYYNMCYKDMPGFTVPIWNLEFEKQDGQCYDFVLDAKTYKIYSINLLVSTPILDIDNLGEGKDSNFNIYEFPYDIENNIKEYYQCNSMLEVNTYYNFSLYLYSNENQDLFYEDVIFNCYYDHYKTSDSNYKNILIGLPIYYDNSSIINRRN